MQINELADLLAVSASTLWNWENTLEVDIPRDELGEQTYPPKWVEYFRQVKALLDAGKKYEQIKQELTPPNPQTQAGPPVPVPPQADHDEINGAIT